MTPEGKIEAERILRETLLNAYRERSEALSRAKGSHNEEVSRWDETIRRLEHKLADLRK